MSNKTVQVHYGLDTVTEELLRNTETAALVTPYLKPLTIFLQLEGLPQTYRGMPLRNLLSFMQLSQETLDELEAGLHEISKKKKNRG